MRLSLDGVVIPRALRAHGFKVLGAQISFDNSATAALNKLITNAWAAFQKNQKKLCSKSASFLRRVVLLDRFVRPVAMYCVGSLNPTRRQLQMFHSLHFKMLRRMLGRVRMQTTPLAEYLQEVARSINNTIAKSGVLWWSDYALKTIHSWAGHLGRMILYDRDRLVSRSLLHKNRKYLLALEASTGSQCHGRRFHVWRWERNLYEFYGPDWLERTYNNDDWNDGFGEWLSWRKNDFNSRKRIGYRSTKRFKISLEKALDCAVTEEQSSSSTDSCTDSSS